jgi:hypothetical protein
MGDELTREWLDVFAASKAAEERLADSPFWRLALHTLPLGVDPDHPEVVAALAEIRASVTDGMGGDR